MLLGSTCLQTLGIEACAATGMATALTAFTTTHGVVNRVHDNTAVVGTTAQPAAAAGLAATLESVVGVANYTYGSLTSEQDLACLTRRQFDNRIVTFADRKSVV